ncbi:MAG: endonuclease/exonuclease/phosphatase family protein [Anaerolineae bacterium]|nr:endonuclease/exonuclease/phosphatase family protein [Anaerolineae bacterium]
MGRPGEAGPDATVTILTYNIQQGYSEDGQKDADGQLALMRAVNADIIGLQESDTNRIAGGNADLVRYYADALDMYAYYGPTTVAGTFGIALLSKAPIENPRTFYMVSEGEQTATIEAQITVDGTAYNVFVTHLGNDGPIIQQKAVLEVVTGKENVILMGDFNFRPDSEQYALATSVLDDAWLRRWPGGSDDTGARPEKRIDHFFITPDLSVGDVRYIDSPASDHPAVTLVLQP